MIITKTPYRISFFGGGSDYPEWYKEHGGMVLSTTIDKYIYIFSKILVNIKWQYTKSVVIDCKTNLSVKF